jgi:D-alanine-D-alanine ligase
MKKSAKLRVLVFTSQDYQHSDKKAEFKDKPIVEWKSEFDVITTLEKLGHQTRVLSDVSEFGDIRMVVKAYEPEIVFNLLEEFRGEGIYVPYVLGYLELRRLPFTGCNPYGLVVCDNKSLLKKILRYHRIPSPESALFGRASSARRLPRRMKFPAIVKSASMHGSVGIAQASVVTSDEKLRERVEFIHDHTQTDAIAEEYIEGRELYAGVLGNQRLNVFPVWEMSFGNLPDGSRPIATDKVKWDEEYQKKLKIKTGAAKNLPEGVETRIDRYCKKAYKALGLSGYARMDFRLTDDGRLFLLEPNPNPDLNKEEDFARAAKAAGMGYTDLIQRIINLGFRYREGK